eukprot:4165513-Prymnesium_polylepis.1
MWGNPCARLLPRKSQAPLACGAPRGANPRTSAKPAAGEMRVHAPASVCDSHGKTGRRPARVAHTTHKARRPPQAAPRRERGPRGEFRRRSLGISWACGDPSDLPVGGRGAAADERRLTPL